MNSGNWRDLWSGGAPLVAAAVGLLLVFLLLVGSGGMALTVGALLAAFLLGYGAVHLTSRALRWGGHTRRVLRRVSFVLVLGAMLSTLIPASRLVHASNTTEILWYAAFGLLIGAHVAARGVVGLPPER